MNIRTIPDIIAASAQRNPDKEAFRCDGVGLSYAALVDSAARLAHVLRDAGVSRGDRVGILLPKSLDSAVAIYGIMAAGAAYVPLDGRAPVDRLANVVADAGLKAVVSAKSRRPTVAALLERVERVKPSKGDAELRAIVVLDALAGDLGQSASAPLWYGAADVEVAPAIDSDAAPASDDLAYIMYTSGSTGQPKGIMHTHASGLAYAMASSQLYGLVSDDRLSNHSSLHFDMSTFDFFSGALAGATTVVIPEAVTILPASMSKLVEDEQMTVWYSVPLALVQMLDRGVLDERDMRALRWVLFGGEPFPPKYLRELMRRLPDARFGNVYGPAEVNQCTYYNVDPAYAWTDDSSPVPLGVMWPAADGLVLGEGDEPAGVGQEGELLVATDTMMRGYWNREDLNDRAFYFARNGLGNRKRYYRTGDVVRLREDGLMDFVGRRDRQVKVRGYRVELDEVERALLSHPDVHEAAAFVREAADGAREIWGAVIPKQDVALDEPQDLLRHVRRELPVYAIPGHLEIVREFPRTTSGKIDRRRLQTELTSKEGASERV